MPRSKEEKSKYDQNYQKSHMKRISIWFNLEKDKDLLDRLESQPDPVAAYIKALIREDLKEYTEMTGFYSYRKKNNRKEK